MCGISFILSSSDVSIEKDALISNLLKKRGPDCSNWQIVQLDEQLSCIFRGSVLWMQGDFPQCQPIVNESGDIFLWNGDQFNKKACYGESDTVSIFKNLENKSNEKFVSVLGSVEGPWAFIYYANCERKIYFGRDIFGRHSLLWSGLVGNKQSFVLSSVGRRQDELKEVPALGIYVADVETLLKDEINICLHPFKHITSEQLLAEDLKNVKILSNDRVNHGIKIPLCKDIPNHSVIEKLKNFSLTLNDDNLALISNFLHSEIELFDRVFENSIRKRIAACPNKCLHCTYSTEACNHSKYAVLFSGGLDSTLIALYLNKCLPEDESIDLLNVSFESRRQENNSKKKAQNLEVKQDFNSPDRLSGLASLKELQKINCKRKWNFVEINVSANELKSERSKIISHLVAPQSSVLDDSIGCALYFCGRGVGDLKNTLYNSPARVVFSGLGADEQLAGYSRHRAKFNEFGWEGLLEEVNLELVRIHQRNCGRDDRVLSHHGRSARFPYLDEEVVSCLNSFPIWKKTNPYLPRGVGEKILLRTIAANNSLFTASSLPKRAIQFGSRIAKLENNKEKGNDICERIQEFHLW